MDLDIPRRTARKRKPLAPVRFRVIAYGERTTQPYDGSDRAAAQSAWDNVEHGIFLGVDEDHAWAAIDRR